MDLLLDQHLLPIVREENYRLLLQRQLLKDFSTAGLLLPPELDTELFSLTQLFSTIQEQLILQLEKGERHTLTLMYAIDIPEKTFLKIISEADFTNTLTQKIIEREAQKIYYRVNFSG